MGAVTKWGLLRHYWVVISLVGTVVLTAVLVLHMPDVSSRAEMAQVADAEHLQMMGSDIVHPLVGLVLLLGILVLNVFKPKGLTRRGWRKEQARSAGVGAGGV